MMKRLVKGGALVSALVVAGGGSMASAQTAETDPPEAFEISANVGLVSDYRFRGLSLSSNDPAIQGGIDVAHESGLFVGTWASSIANYGGATAELDLYGGYAGSAAGLDYSVTALAYVYPGGSGVDYFELKATAAKTIGPATFDLAASWVPDQDSYPGDNVYLSAGAEVGIPGTPVTVHARAGRESSASLRKWDWEAGAAYSFGKLTASLAYIDSDYGGINEAGRRGRATVVASLLASF